MKCKTKVCFKDLFKLLKLDTFKPLINAKVKLSIIEGSPVSSLPLTCEYIVL